jgi:hypothetical protein
VTPNKRSAAIEVLAAAGFTLRDVHNGFGDVSDTSLAAAVNQVVDGNPRNYTGAELAVITSAFHTYKTETKKRPDFNRKSEPIVEAIKAVFERYTPPLTVRQVYYQLASSGLVQLSKSGYSTAQRLQLKLRELGVIPWGWYADRARERIRAHQWDDLSAYADAIGGYRKDLWQAQPEHVEFWLEKDALRGFVADALERFGNPLCVVRGFSSGTFVHECAQVLNRIRKPKFIYYIGDHDPSGLSIEKNVMERLTEFGSEFHFKRIAIDLDDIKTYDLRPLTAKPSDSRYEKYVAKHGTTTVEVDALPPDVLRRRIEDAVNRHIDVEQWRRMQLVEKVEQERIVSIQERMRSLPVFEIGGGA